MKENACGETRVSRLVLCHYEMYPAVHAKVPIVDGWIVIRGISLEFVFGTMKWVAVETEDIFRFVTFKLKLKFCK